MPTICGLARTTLSLFRQFRTALPQLHHSSSSRKLLTGSMDQHYTHRMISTCYLPARPRWYPWKCGSWHRSTLCCLASRSPSRILYVPHTSRARGSTITTYFACLENLPPLTGFSPSNHTHPRHPETLVRVPVALSGHRDFASYYERFDHASASFRCRCGARTSPMHFFYYRIGCNCRMLRTLHGQHITLEYLLRQMLAEKP